MFHPIHPSAQSAYRRVRLLPGSRHSDFNDESADMGGALLSSLACSFLRATLN
jgi:hypothetical protein